MKAIHAECVQDPSKCPDYVKEEGLGDSVRGIAGLPPLVLPERRGFHLRNNNESKVHLEFLEKYYKLSSFNRENTGYQLQEIVKSCSFNFKPCEFRHNLNMRYGNCFTFNQLNGDFQNVLIETSVGPSNGLEMSLSIEPDQYLSISHTTGIRIAVHDPSDEPNPEDKGITIAPGFETHVALKQTVMRRLPAPYKDECVFYGDETRSLMKSRTLCVQACIQEYNFAKCGCIEPTFWTMSPYKHCNTTNSAEMNCLDSLVKDLATHGADCQCPPPCLSKHYNEQITKALWPSSASFLEKNISNISEASLELYRKYHARVRIFFSTLERSVYEQTGMFHDSEMLSNLGGEFALWLGLSLFVLCELMEAFFFLVNYLMCDVKERIDLLSLNM
ncbi:Degenerin mec-10 like protein [Argiope bruennichi]|uniref:Degenerin mec-10 like protein n=1 Tax=Argiope bruennichi TaxID=94029 RepID=A0A8T0FXI2_ARGBR|nr:Degenerin mec-10 like protein [Argiope bruennichi]